MAAAEVTAATPTKVSATAASEMATAAETAAASEVPTTPETTATSETTAAHAPRLSVRPAQRQEQRRPRRKNVFNVH
jgi:hypothetical protein